MEAHLSFPEIEARAAAHGPSPTDKGVVQMIVCRPRLEERLILQQAELDTETGLVGDSWLTRGSSRTADGSAHPGMQLTIMNSRVIAALEREQARWPLAGDQLFIDLDLSEDNLPPGQRLAIGTAVVEISPIPHTGCAKFTERFGSDAIKFVNSPEGRRLRRRGVNVRIVQGGVVRVGDEVTKIKPD